MPDRLWQDQLDLDDFLLPKATDLDSLPDDLGTDYGEQDQEPPLVLDD